MSKKQTLTAIGAALAIVVAVETRGHAQTQGCVNGRLADPRAYVRTLIGNQPASNFVAVLNAIDPQLKRYGIGQQRRTPPAPGALGNPSSRLFLPTSTCPDASGAYSAPPQPPSTPACWDHAVDTIDSQDGWVWVDRGGPAYTPYACDAGQPPPTPPLPPTPPPPVPPPPPAPDLTSRVLSLERAVVELNQRLGVLEAKPIPTSCRASVFGIGVSCRLQ